MSASAINERALMLGTRPNGGRVTRLRINPNRFNRVTLSARVNDKYVNCELTIDEWGMLCQNIAAAARTQEEVVYETITSKNNTPHSVARTGRDSDGIVYLEIEEFQAGKERFFFLPLRQFVSMINGQLRQDGELSRARAINWVDQMKPLVMKHWEAEYKEEDKNAQGGGYQKQQSGYQKPQGGYQKPQGGYQKQQGGYQKQQYGGGNNSAPSIDGDLDAFLH